MKAIEWLGNALKILDQTKLPLQTLFREAKSYEEVAEAIERMEVRGAPVIGAAAAYGYALGALSFSGPRAEFTTYMEEVQNRLAATRPTAVNLFWALRRMEDRL
ncbi:MAG: S-methyl-5-thioribose-1-phosphate isomerase, partial [Desulfitobacteriaceae bacterium]